MSQPQPKPITTIPLSEKDWVKLQNYINDTVVPEIQAQFQAWSKASKIREESMYATLESLQNSITFMQKEFNHKIGGIRSRQTADENRLNTFSGLDEAVKVANQIRLSKGLPPIVLPAEEPPKDESRTSGHGKRI